MATGSGKDCSSYIELFNLVPFVALDPFDILEVFFNFKPFGIGMKYLLPSYFDSR